MPHHLASGLARRDPSLALARELARRGVRRFAVQNARSSPTAAAASRLGPGAQEMLRGWFDEFACR